MYIEQCAHDDRMVFWSTRVFFDVDVGVDVGDVGWCQLMISKPEKSIFLQNGGDATSENLRKNLLVFKIRII